VADPGGHTYVFEYDSQGRLKKTINPDSTYRNIQYDDMTNTITVIDENPHMAKHHYDWNGSLLWVKEYTDPVNYYLTQYTYDSGGNLTSMTDAQGNTTAYVYDSLFGVTEGCCEFQITTDEHNQGQPDIYGDIVV
jgi:uncharacterized protein RhaS with RHS repeats